jgi:PKHD-type hydroxylase
MEKLDEIDIPKYKENKKVLYPQWLMYVSIIPKDICEHIITEAKKLPHTHGTVFSSNNKQIVSDIRKTQIRWITKEMNHFQPLFHFVDKVVREVNEAFRVNCNMVPTIQFTEYLEPGYHYNWHHDVDWNRTDGKSRKISFVIQLSDPESYTGGDFEFKNHENPNSTKLRSQGTTICFMPYQEHRVKSIESGSRYSLVGWYEGPRWV